MFISVMKCIWQAKPGLCRGDESAIAGDGPDWAESANPVACEPSTNPSNVYAVPTACLSPEQGPTYDWIFRITYLGSSPEWGSSSWKEGHLSVLIIMNSLSQVEDMGLGIRLPGFKSQLHHLNSKQTFMEHQLYTRTFSRCWGDSTELSLCSYEAYIPEQGRFNSK